MKVTVTKYLNVRVGKPSVNAPCFQYLAPGSELEVDGKLYSGDNYNDIDTWLRDEANNYYWSGGTNYSDPRPDAPSETAQFDPRQAWWLKDYGIPELWDAGLSGKGVKVAVMDSGLALPHKDLAVNQAQCVDLTNSESGIDDKVGHGTHTTGIIAATNNDFGTTGIAYGCDLFFGKISHDVVGDRMDFLTKGVEWAVQTGVDIISLSIGFDDDDSKLQQAIDRAVAQDILIVAAAGNDHNLGDVLYPARYDHVLAVGACDNRKAASKSTVNAAQTNVFAPGEQIYSTFLTNKYEELSGSSQAVPFVSAVAALALEKVRKENKDLSPLEVGKLLLEAAEDKSFGKIIDPTSLINNS